MNETMSVEVAYSYRLIGEDDSKPLNEQTMLTVHMIPSHLKGSELREYLEERIKADNPHIKSIQGLVIKG